MVERQAQPLGGGLTALNRPGDKMGKVLTAAGDHRLRHRTGLRQPGRSRVVVSTYSDRVEKYQSTVL